MTKPKEMKDTAPCFTINDNKGFQMVLPNGWTVSIQFGPGNYCDNYDKPIMANYPEGFRSTTAEIAAWDAAGTWYDFGHDKVDGRKTVAEVLEFINTIAAKEPTHAQKA